MIIDFIKQIEVYLQSELSDLGLDIKATPKQHLIGGEYKMLDTRGEILINAELDDFENQSFINENVQFAKGKTLITYAVEVSVGIVNFNETFVLEQAIIRVVEALSYKYNAEFTPLIPEKSGISFADSNSTQWKTITFKTTKKFTNQTQLIGV